MRIINLITANSTKLLLMLFGVLISLLVAWNNRLTRKNQTLLINNQVKDKTIKIQTKVLDVAQNHKDTDFNGIIKRMQDEHL